MKKDFWRRFRAFDKKGLLFSRVEGCMAWTLRGYQVNRRIFQVYLIIVLGLIAFMFFSSPIGWREVYVHCPANSTEPCINPLYLDCPLEACESIELNKTLPQGFELGTPPSQDFNQQLNGLGLFIISGLVLAFLINHFRYNRGRSFLLLFPKARLD